MRLAYADPPYPGCAHLYPENTEVDHAELVEQLSDFDGWALSTNETALQDVLALCPAGVRVLAWTKPNAIAYASHPSPTWEPVICKPARLRATGPRVSSHLSAPVDQGFLGPVDSPFPGRKPLAFGVWVIRCLAAEASDTFVDIFPGMGNIAAAWESFVRQPELTLSTLDPAGQRGIEKQSRRLAALGQGVIE